MGLLTGQDIVWMASSTASNEYPCLPRCEKEYALPSKLPPSLPGQRKEGMDGCETVKFVIACLVTIL
jgi:hypothetical protein